MLRQSDIGISIAIRRAHSSVAAYLSYNHHIIEKYPHIKYVLLYMSFQKRYTTLHCQPWRRRREGAAEAMVTIIFVSFAASRIAERASDEQGNWSKIAEFLR